MIVHIPDFYFIGIIEQYEKSEVFAPYISSTEVPVVDVNDVTLLSTTLEGLIYLFKRYGDFFAQKNIFLSIIEEFDSTIW